MVKQRKSRTVGNAVSRRASRRSRKTTRKQRRTYGGAWYDPRTWGANSTPIALNNSVVVEPTAAPRSTMAKLFSNTQQNRNRSISSVLPSQQGSRYLTPKLRFSEQNTVTPIPKIGSFPVGSSSNTRTRRLRPNLPSNVIKQTSSGNMNAYIARYVAQLFQSSNTLNDMNRQVQELKESPYIKQRIRNQFLRNYENVFNSNNNSTYD